MSEEKKRFFESLYSIIDREKGRNLQGYEVINLLNELNDENGHLKKENEQLKKARDESDKFIVKKGLEVEFLNWCVANE